jgi:hypothetical protein
VGPGGEILAMDPGKGFKSKISKKDIPELCASCHSDVKKMTPYGLPTDQFDHYKVSQHGILLYQKGDTNVAVCTDCHGTHDILRKDNPKSRIYVDKVPSTCARCHSDSNLMKKYGIPSDQYEQYVKSVHGEALLEKGNLSAPNCARCHGTHGATPPGVSHVSDVCGQCHNKTREYFNQSPHKKAVLELGLPECEMCHGNHEISRPGLETFDTACVNCHTPDSKGFKAGQNIRNLMQSAWDDLKKTERMLHEAEENGMYVEEENATLEEARTNLIQVVPVQHTLSIGMVEDYTEKASSISGGIREKIGQGFEDRRKRKLGVFLVWAIILSFVLIFYEKFRRVEKGDK